MNLQIRMFAPLLLIPTIVFASHEVNWSICESDTQCTKCLESGSVVVEKKNDKVSVAGKSPLGIPVTGELTKCDFKSDNSWTCVDGRVRIVNAEGQVRIEYTGKTVVFNGKKLEFCSVQVR
jgi:hypothetical protein